MKKTSVILAVHNKLTYTQQCVAVLQDSLYGQDCELIVVDEASSDGTAEWLAGQDSLRVICLEHCCGRSAAFNEGAETASGEAMLFLSNEVLLFPETFLRMCQQLWQNDKVGAVGPMANYAFYLQQLGGADYQSFEELALFVHDLPQRISNSEPQACFFLGDFCLMVKREVWQKLNGFGKDFSGASIFTDADFGFRLWQAGYSALLVREAYVHREKQDKQVSSAAEREKTHFREKWQIDIEYSCHIRKPMLRYIEQKKKGLVVLEAGCACGANLMQLRQANPSAELYGVEINEHATKIAACFGKIYNLDLEKFSMPEWQDKFDAVLMGDILEHLRDPWQVVRDMHRITKPGGRIIISVPNVMHLSMFYRLLQGDWSYAESGILDRTHLRFFTKQTAMRLLREAGWQVKDIGYSQIVMPDNIKPLREKLIGLLGEDVRPEQLDAYQWFVVGEKR